ncbi:uncharacterized protein VICG_00299 [Vittaforma corneae ATCC 50505]|uniref:Uncharacterized protein n=1 Tax=Vittaforma corneae (strain ATCC 50505) TaxID=993615 RepID=L2GQE2_VITCO|nr:uncharacterized protein VICG_00299 [Vittaforma corneae ATCC 50505]ELA42547.1 hypothetical protein VICG_00299 [Vittaforma corneae ATCC 50505]
MGFSRLLYSALLSPITTPHIEYTDPCTLRYDPLKVILYESYIPIDALTFKIGTGKMNKNEVRGIVDSILDVKKNILLHVDNAAKVFNLSETINERGPMKNFLIKRLNLIQSDESFIFKELIRDKQDQILKCIGALKGKAIHDPMLDKQYRQMIGRIYEAVYENLDIQETINREKEELYREYRQDIPKSEFTRARIALSLGSSIFYLPELVNLMEKINLKDKNRFVRDWINTVFEPIEKLAISTSSKSFIEQKHLVKEFIKNSTETGSSNIAFEARAGIIRAANLSVEQIKELSSKQNAENLRLLEVLENMREASWIVKYNKQIKEDMITYLMTRQPEDKKRVLNHFA